MRSQKDKIRLLNELEFAKGSVFANVWRSDKVIQIHSKSGCVEAVYDLKRLRTQIDRYYGELNGIAYDPFSDIFFLTGKNWPKIFRVKLRH